MLHDHKETSKRNALFLIKSSERLPDYDSNVLTEMKKAYNEGSYDDVADLAYLHDRNRSNPQLPESRITTFCRKLRECWHILKMNCWAPYRNQQRKGIRRK